LNRRQLNQRIGSLYTRGQPVQHNPARPDSRRTSAAPPAQKRCISASFTTPRICTAAAAPDYLIQGIFQPHPFDRRSLKMTPMVSDAALKSLPATIGIPIVLNNHPYDHGSYFRRFAYILSRPVHIRMPVDRSGGTGCLSDVFRDAAMDQLILESV